MWRDLWAAFALLLVIEGILPFASPATWRRLMRSVLEMDDRALRVAGLTSMACGVVLLYLTR